MYQKWPSKPSILSRVSPGHLYYLFLDITPTYFPNIFCKIIIISILQNLKIWKFKNPGSLTGAQNASQEMWHGPQPNYGLEVFLNKHAGCWFWIASSLVNSSLRAKHYDNNECAQVLHFIGSSKSLKPGQVDQQYKDRCGEVGSC